MYLDGRFNNASCDFILYSHFVLLCGLCVLCGSFKIKKAGDAAPSGDGIPALMISKLGLLLVERQVIAGEDVLIAEVVPSLDAVDICFVVAGDLEESVAAFNFVHDLLA